MGSEGEGEAANGGGGEEGSRTGRLPRWTRQEILVLIQGKRVAESKVRRVRTSSEDDVVVEPKWASVSSYCRMHGVNRGPVQCRKRWSNLSGDFKKIKEWESSTHSTNSDSFWSMRNDLRRDRKLPGFFDKEVYDILDRPIPTTTIPPPPPPPLFDSRRSDDGMFSDDHPPPQPISEEGRKRKRGDDDDDANDDGVESSSKLLLDVLDRNSKTLAAQLDAQNQHLQLDRDLRKTHSDGLLAVLNKLADALIRISDKL